MKKNNTNNINNIICHIMGLNPITKKIFINSLNKQKYYIMDLDNINDKILKDNEMDKMFKKYDKLKNKKNDKYKDIDKKML